jgi:hypothetical protein
VHTKQNQYANRKSETAYTYREPPFQRHSSTTSINKKNSTSQ